MEKITITCIFVLIFASCGNKLSHEAPQVDSTVVAVDTVGVVIDSLQSESQTVTDVDGNTYQTVRIGNQVWMAENLRVKHFNNGDPIPWITNPEEWQNLSSAAYCCYKSDVDSMLKYGCFYNIKVVSDHRNVAPEGWKIPSEDDWSILEAYLIKNGYNYDKSTSTNKIAKSLASNTAWFANETVGSPGCKLSSNNKSGFNAIPANCYGGGYEMTNSFVDNIVIGLHCCFWVKPKKDETSANYRGLKWDEEVFSNGIMRTDCALSIRCVKNKTYTSSATNTNNSGNSWLIGTWEVQTDVGLMSLTVINSQSATFLDESGTYTIVDGVLKWRDGRGIVSPFTINYSNQTLKVDGSNYVLKKRNSLSNNNQTNSSSSSHSNKSFQRSYRDNFSCRSAVFEFLANHTFKSSDGTRITYDMSTLSLTFSSGKSAFFTNVELIGYNQNIARIRAICTNVSGYSATFTLNASSGTVTDSDGTLYRAVN